VLLGLVDLLPHEGVLGDEDAAFPVDADEDAGPEGCDQRRVLVLLPDPLEAVGR